MHASFVIFSLLVVLSQSASLFSSKGNVTAGKPFFGNITAAGNLQGVAKLSLKTDRPPLSICVVPLPFLLPHYSQYNQDNCQFYFNATNKGDNQHDLALLNIAYTFGISFSGVSEDNTTVDVTLNADVCDNLSYWNSTNCSPATLLDVSLDQKGWNTTFEGNFSKGETKFWTLELPVPVSNRSEPRLIGNFKLAIGTGSLSVENSIVYARFNGGPTKTHHDAASNTATLIVVSPRPGLWVFSVKSVLGGLSTFHLSGVICGPNKGGDCSISVAPASNENVTHVVEFPSWQYFSVNVGPGLPLVVSVSTANATLLPKLYALQGQIPSSFPTGAPVGSVSADIANCTGKYCDVVRNINYTATTNQTWYIAVETTTANLTFGLWWNTSCISRCEEDNHGECLPSGQCSCTIGYVGLDCAFQDGIPLPYIVLIIIASLVIVSALIGFVAWAYMRRKRANYEIVS